MTRLRRTSVVLHMPWSVTGPLDAMDAAGLSSLFEAAAEQLILEQVLRQVLSGPNTGTDFAADTNSITGLWGSGIVHTVSELLRIQRSQKGPGCPPALGRWRRIWLMPVPKEKCVSWDCRRIYFILIPGFCPPSIPASSISMSRTISPSRLFIVNCSTLWGVSSFPGGRPGTG